MTRNKRKFASALKKRKNNIYLRQMYLTPTDYVKTMLHIN